MLGYDLFCNVDIKCKENVMMFVKLISFFKFIYIVLNVCDFIFYFKFNFLCKLGIRFL